MNNQTSRIVVASGNPVKVQAALDGFRQMFPELTFETVSVAVPSGVADQPLTDDETLAGAINRVNNAAAAQPDGDFWIGLEGGVATMGEELTAFAWIVVKDAAGRVGKARSGTFFLPEAVAKLVEQGTELGHADDIVFGSRNSKQAGGAIGLLTNQVVTRTLLYEQAVMLALVPFKNERLYPIASVEQSR